MSLKLSLFCIINSLYSILERTLENCVPQIYSAKYALVVLLLYVRYSKKDSIRMLIDFVERFGRTLLQHSAFLFYNCYNRNDWLRVSFCLRNIYHLVRTV